MTLPQRQSCPNVSLESTARNILDRESLIQIMNHSYDPIFITDKNGKCLLSTDSSSMAARTLGIDPQELVGTNVKDLVERRIYNWSPTLEAIKTRSVATGIMATRNGSKLMATSTPIFEDGEITMVITNIRDIDLLEKYILELESEKVRSKQYKTAIEYLGEVDKQSIVAESPQMQKIFKSAKTIAKADTTVMLSGESGTGKEVLARYIHRNSLRANEPFIPVNCAAIPDNLFESEFFGYVRGAFTGANSQGKLGLFEIADRGTLFLDEIGELPMPMQSKLLRILETGQVQRLGSTKINQVNIRLIVATNRNLKERVNQGLFRSDLYYRLNVIPLLLPPLRERQEDIVVLANRFLSEFNSKYGLHRVFNSQTLQSLLNYNWPGNIRELRNIIEREVIISTKDDLRIDFEAVEKGKRNSDNTNIHKMDKFTGYRGTLKNVLKGVEREYINYVLSKCNGKMGVAANLLGIHRTMLYRKIHYKEDSTL